MHRGLLEYSRSTWKMRMRSIAFIPALMVSIVSMAASTSLGQDTLTSLTVTRTAGITLAEPGGNSRFNNSVSAIAYSHDGSTLAVGMRDPNMVLLLDPVTLAIRARLEGNLALVHDVKFTPDGKSLISAGMDGSARVWDLATMRQRLLIDQFHGNVRGLAITSDSRRIYTAEAARGPKGTVTAWDAKDGRRIGSLEDYQHGIESLELSPDGRTIATCSRDRSIRQWDSATFAPKNQFDSAGSFPTDLSYTPDGKLLAAVFNDGTLCLLETETMVVKYKVRTGARMFVYLSMTPDGSILATADDNRLQFWRASDGSPLASVADVGGRIFTIQFSPDGQKLAVGGTSGLLRVFQMERVRK